MSEYPEHDKLREVQQESQAIGIFLEHMGGKGYHIARYESQTDAVYDFETDSLREVTLDQRLVVTTKSIEQLLGEHFGIDPKKLQEEKQKMFASLRSAD